jgi:hypothetical protein
MYLPIESNQAPASSIAGKMFEDQQTMQQCIRRWWLMLDVLGIQYL